MFERRMAASQSCKPYHLLLAPSRTKNKREEGRWGKEKPPSRKTKSSCRPSTGRGHLGTEWTVELFGMLCLGNFAGVFLGGWSFGGWLRRVTFLRRKLTRMILMRRPRSGD